MRATLAFNGLNPSVNLLFLILLATTSFTSSSQLKFCWCWSDKYFIGKSKCLRLISRYVDFLIVFSFEQSCCSLWVLVLNIISKSLFSDQIKITIIHFLCLPETALWKLLFVQFITNHRYIMGTCPDNFSQRISRGQRRKS